MSEFVNAAAWLSPIFLLYIFVFLVRHETRNSISRLQVQLSRLDRQLDLLLKRAGVERDPSKDLPLEVEAALLRGDKIVAIVEYSKATGAGLKEAKDFIDKAMLVEGRDTKE